MTPPLSGRLFASSRCRSLMRPRVAFVGGVFDRRRRGQRRPRQPSFVQSARSTSRNRRALGARRGDAEQRDPRRALTAARGASPGAMRRRPTPWVASFPPSAPDSATPAAATRARSTRIRRSGSADHHCLSLERFSTLSRSQPCFGFDRTLAQWRMTGAGPTFVRLGRRVHYRAVDINAWLESPARGSTSDPGVRRSHGTLGAAIALPCACWRAKGGAPCRAGAPHPESSATLP
jgi:hypothetical protein